MGESLFSTSWYRVVKLRPKLNNTIIVVRHVYRKQPWYVLVNSFTGASHRFNAAAYNFIGQMDGKKTVQEIWENSAQTEESSLPTQDACIRLLAVLHDSDFIQSEILPSTLSLIRANKQTKYGNWKQHITNPFFQRLPLWNPNHFLDRWKSFAAPFFSKTALVIWAVTFLSAVILALLNWPDLTNSWADRILATHNLILLWLTFPILKIFHELGHAFAVKHWGGEVHEIGITLLALTPIPYVNASAAIAFSSKWQRITVSAMGMMVELFISSLALFVWLNVETGMLSTISYNIFFLGGASSLLFNGNPLMRYDGYYMLSDYLEIPNLWQRSNRYLGYLLQRYLLRNNTVESPVTARGEKIWFLLYGPLAFCYRTIVLISLVWLVSTHFFLVGIGIAIWGTISMILLPAVRGFIRILGSQSNSWTGTRLISSVLALFLIVVFFILPMPSWTSTQGIVWLPEQSILRAGTNFEIVKLLATPDHHVEKGDALIQGEDPSLGKQIEIIRAQLTELQAEYDSYSLHEQVERKIVLDGIKELKVKLAHAEKKQKQLVVRSPVTGKFVLIDPRNLPGHFIHQGELLGYVLSEKQPIVRAIVEQTDIGLVREENNGAEIRLAERPFETIEAQINRIIPEASFVLPSAALGTSGGGPIATDPSQPDGLHAFETIFQLDLQLPESISKPHIGSRVYVRIKHDHLPLAFQWFRKLRQLLLKKFYD